MMTGIGPMKVEGRKLSDKVIWRAPDLNMRPMRHGNVPAGEGY